MTDCSEVFLNLMVERILISFFRSMAPQESSMGNRVAGSGLTGRESSLESTPPNLSRPFRPQG